MPKAYEIEKTVLIPSKVNEIPCMRTRCKIILSTIHKGTSKDQLEKLSGLKVDELMEIQVGSCEGDMGNVIDSMLKKMNVGSKVKFEIKFLENSLLLPNETISFVLEFLSVTNAASQIFELGVEFCLAVAEEYKEIGTRLFKESRTYAATCFYSKAVKYLINAYHLCDAEDQNLDKAGKMLSVCYLNLAACLLKYNRYADVIANCTDAMQYHPNSEKALYRRAKAYLCVNDFENADKDISLGLKLYCYNNGFNELAAELKKKLSKINLEMSHRLKAMFL